MRRILTLSLTIALLAAFMLAGCSKPWSHPDYSGQAETDKFKRDSFNCEVQSKDVAPLDKHKRLKVYKACMTDKGWQHSDDHSGFRFSTKPR